MKYDILATAQYIFHNSARNDEILHHKISSGFLHALHMLSFFCVLFLLISCQVIVGGPGGHVSLLFRAFSNPSNLLLSGDCCDPACAVCNYYFLFCIRNEPSSASCLVSGKSKTYHNYKHLVFTYGDALGNGWQNPIEGSFSSWKVRSFPFSCFLYWQHVIPLVEATPEPLSILWGNALSAICSLRVATLKRSHFDTWRWLH